MSMEYVTLFQKGQIIEMYETNKITEEIAESSKIVLGPIKGILKACKNNVELSHSNKLGQNKTLSNCDSRSLKCSVKSNHRKTFTFSPLRDTKATYQ